jgi:exodeoxyribonuclease VII large subunit
MPVEPKPDKIYSVSELNALAESVLVKSIGETWVRGEVSGLKTQSSGHVYFSLKDDKGVLSVALFRGAAMKNTVKLQEGKQIVVFGSVGIYSPSGRYQMVARLVLDEGLGKLQQEFERLKKLLEAEGLFSKERKIAIPRFPGVLAFITSPTGAVWQDFTRILARREWRGRVLLLPCRVQGAEAPLEIVGRLRQADVMEEVELIVVGRGGGSIEDLWAFNDERVVRAIAATQKPVIAAVGHETDFTLCDFAADFRAETPSAAAELIAGHFNDARIRLGELWKHLLNGGLRLIMLLKRHLEGLAARLSGRSPRVIIDRTAQRLDELWERISMSLKTRLTSSRERLATLAAHLHGIDPAGTLRRGYAMVRDDTGRIISRAGQVESNQELTLRWADGEKKARATS